MREDKAFAMSTIDGYTQCGMDLRDYFAAKAMEGILSGWDYLYEGQSVFKPDIVATRAYLIADAMLNAREGK